MKAPPGHRILHAKGQFYSGTFNASPEATAICRARHLQGDTVPVLVRWSHGSGRPDSNDDAPYVRGMAVSFVLPDGKSTDLLGQTVPRFPVRTPEDFVRLTEVARDRRALVKFLATRPRTALALAANARAKALAPPKSYAEATYFPIHAYQWLTLAGARHLGALPVRARRRRRATARGAVHGPRPVARGDARPARAGAGEVRPGRHRRRAEGQPAQPDVGVEGQPRVRGRLVRDHHAGGRPRGPGRRRRLRPDPGGRRDRAERRPDPALPAVCLQRLHRAAVAAPRSP